jgi:hypothetical protein
MPEPWVRRGRVTKRVDWRPKRDPLHFDHAADLKDSSGSSLHDIGNARDPTSDNFLHSRQSVTGIAMGVHFGRRSTGVTAATAGGLCLCLEEFQGIPDRRKADGLKVRFGGLADSSNEVSPWPPRARTGHSRPAAKQTSATSPFVRFAHNRPSVEWDQEFADCHHREGQTRGDGAHQIFSIWRNAEGLRTVLDRSRRARCGRIGP